MSKRTLGFRKFQKPNPQTPLEREQHTPAVEEVDSDHSAVDGVEGSFRELIDDSARDFGFADSYDAATGRKRKGGGKVQPRRMSYSTKPGPVIIGTRPLKPPGRK